MSQKVLVVHQKDKVSWNQQDLMTMVSWFKYLGDSKIPSKKEQLLRHYDQTNNRIELKRTYLKPGEHAIVDGDDEDDDEQDVGAGALM